MAMTNRDYYKTIGKLIEIVHLNKDYDMALKEGVKIILECSEVDYVSLWYKKNGQGDEIHPYYWICPLDFTSSEEHIGKGIIGKTVETGRPILADESNREEYDEDLRKMEVIGVKSLYTVPIEDNGGGCLLFMKKKDSFSDDEMNTYQMLTMMVSMYIEEGEYLDNQWEIQNPIISVRNLKKSFKNGDIVTHVLKGVNLDVIDGEFLAVLGESGCGKSTLLNIIGGMDQADEGTFTYNGHHLENATEDELTEYRRKNIGFIFQGYNLMPNLNAKQNLDLIGELVDNPMDSDEALEIVGLIEKKHHYPSQLSGGQQQRVSIARAFMKRPKVIFADEPTSALDYETSIEVLSAMEKIVDTGTTLVMVTHNEEITKMADRVVHFRNGKTYEITINKKKAKATELVW